MTVHWFFIVEPELEVEADDGADQISQEPVQEEASASADSEPSASVGEDPDTETPFKAEDIEPVKRTVCT